MSDSFFVRHLKRGSVFLLIGGVGFVVDAIVYNLLVYGPHEGILFHYPIVAKTIAVGTGLIATFIGNRLLTYRDRRKNSRSLSQVARFALVNVVATLLQLGCLWFSRYVLHLANPVADNISGTLIGQALATGFRYISYTKWVFPHQNDNAEVVEPVDSAL